MSIIPTYYVESEPLYASTIGQGIKTMCITSAGRREGVSTIAYSLARRSAAGGRKTLLADFNLYHPSAGARLGVRSAEWDFSDQSYLDAIVDFPEINLSILPAPDTRFATSSMLEKEEIKLHLDFLHQQYDAIIIDTSPVNLHNFREMSGELIASVADATILVVHGGQTSQLSVQLAVEGLERSGAQFLGYVMNAYNNPGAAVEIKAALDRLGNKFPRLSPLCQKCGQLVQTMQESI